MGDALSVAANYKVELSAHSGAYILPRLCVTLIYAGVAITRVAGYPVSGPDLFSQFGTRLNGAIGRLGMDQDLAISIYTPHGQWS